MSQKLAREDARVVMELRRRIFDRLQLFKDSPLRQCENQGVKECLEILDKAHLECLDAPRQPLND